MSDIGQVETTNIKDSNLKQQMNHLADARGYLTQAHVELKKALWYEALAEEARDLRDDIHEQYMICKEKDHGRK